MNITQLFDDECREYAHRERIEMRDAMDRLASVLGVEVRQIYSYRRGTTPLPATAIPILCRLFRSSVLLTALEEDCRELPLDNFDLKELAMEVSETAVPLSNDLIRFALMPRPPYEKLREICAEVERLTVRLRQAVGSVRADYELRRASC